MGVVAIYKIGKYGYNNYYKTPVAPGDSPNDDAASSRRSTGGSTEQDTLDHGNDDVRSPHTPYFF